MNIGGDPYKGRGSSSTQAIDNGDGPDDTTNVTVGFLLADIANAIDVSIHTLNLADRQHWGPDEFEQVRALEDALDEAKEDFQQLGPLLKGSFYYENDRRPESVDELGSLRTDFLTHAQTFEDWVRQGGPIDPLWINETARLKRDLRRAQRRAAARIFASQRADITGGPGQRCLGAFEVYRRQRLLDERREGYEQQQRNSSRYESTRDELAGQQGQKPQKRVQSWEQGTPVMGAHMADAVEMGQLGNAQQYSQQPDGGPQEARKSAATTTTTTTTAIPKTTPATPLEELVPACNLVGHFERFGEQDVAFACDFCDGFVVWEDLARMPNERDPTAVAAGVTEQPNWQARGKSLATAEDKTVVFAPLAIANHVPPDLGDWQARILCPYCDDYNYYEQGEEDEMKYVQDERGFGGLDEFQAHLEWYHTSTAMPGLPSAKNCVVM